jgi:hypothetical protein
MIHERPSWAMVDRVPLPVVWLPDRRRLSARLGCASVLATGPLRSSIFYVNDTGGDSRA